LSDLQRYNRRFEQSVGARRFVITQKIRKVTKEEYELLADFRFHLRQFLRFSEEAAQTVGLTPQYHQALLTIKGFPGRERVTIGELAERLQIKHHSAVGLVNRLVAQGLVVRENATDDRRIVYVSLTEAGSHVLEQLTAAHRDELRRIGVTLNELIEQVARS
jgi:DNA-binding MarR family transcriptional regulator